MSENVLIKKEDGVLFLTINRPQIRNAVDDKTMNALGKAIKQSADDGETRVVVLTGAGGAFCAGADVRRVIEEGISGDDAHKILTGAYAPTLLAIRECPWPVIAAVDGYAAGLGCDMALRCDLRLVSERGVFAELFIRVGLIPDGGGTYLLPRMVGLSKAMEIMLLGEDIPAEDARRLGIANRVYPIEIFEEEITRFAKKLAQQAPLALMRGKKAMLAALEGGTYADALQREAEFQRQIFNSEDGFEGFAAFLEKRPPQWKGR